MAEMNDEVRKYLRTKYADQLDQLNTAQAFANLGDVIAGNKVGSQNSYYDSQRKTAEGQTLDRIDKYDKFKAQQSQAEAMADFRKEQLAQQKTIAEMNDARMREISNENRRQRASEAATKAEEKKIKDAELSTAQAKQLGLAEMSNLSVAQYNNALKKDPNYDPTSMWNKLDQIGWVPQDWKSDTGKEMVAAQDAWVEANLRDASGAAIPVDERSNYYPIYFPVVGDTEAIKANKAALRKQKERIALLGAGPGASKFNPETPPPVKPKTKVINGQTYEQVQGGWKKVGK